MKTFALACLNVLFILPAVAQNPNGCSVVAKMSPSGDSVLNTSGSVAIQNASVNATTYKFIVNGINNAMNQPLYTYVGVGLMTIKLVAYNGSCSDTTVSYYFNPGQAPTDSGNTSRSYGDGDRLFKIKGLNAMSDTNLLLYGHRIYSFNYNEAQMGVAIKTKQSGCIAWARKMPVDVSLGTSIDAMKQAPDGNIFMLTTMSFRPRYLTKLDSTGNLVWTRALQDTGNLLLYFLEMEVLTDGGIVTISTSPAIYSSFVTRFDKNGLIVWQKRYDFSNSYPDNFENLLVKDGFLYISGNLSATNPARYGTFISKIALSNGQTVWMKEYNSGPELIVSNMVSADTSIVVNILKPSSDPERPTIGGFMRIDTSGVIITAALITETYSISPFFGPFVPINSRVTISGNNYYITTSGTEYNFISGNKTSIRHIRLDSLMQVKWANQYINALSDLSLVAPTSNRGSIIGTLSVGPVLTEAVSVPLYLIPVDSSGGNPNASCYGFNSVWETIMQYIAVSNVQWTTDETANNIAVTRTIPWQDYYPQMRYNCPYYIDSCSFLKITGAASVCNLTSTYIYKSHRNKSCGQQATWTASPGTQIVAQTDSNVTVKFLNFGRHLLYASNKLTCVPVQDSLVIIAASVTVPPNLGNDLRICPGNTTVLHAGTQFLQYQWQDGSTDSLLTINQPGLYWVKTTDSCGNIFSDTISVNNAPPIPLSIGNDRSICINDTLHLSATAGFMNYQWSPAYQASSITGQSIIVNPLVDTFYSIMAEMSPGCFGYDTVRITVNTAPAINLGADKSFCLGDSLVLNSGNGFTAYAWSNNAVTQRITVKNPGNYSVIGTTINGCKAYDTVVVMSVFPLPAPRLDRNNILCTGTSRVLDAGSGYARYNWSTGESSQQITVTTLNNYFVTVTDANGCKGSDTTKINRLQALPSSFLPADVAICSYEKALLKPSSAFSKYLWSNGETAAAITVNNAGLYWLQATDQFGCEGRDSIVVTVKTDCIKGVFVPTAFTPNDDTNNDILKPLIYGTAVRRYDFKIFNRWGVIVFQSTDPAKGWNGNLNGQPQDAGTYVWLLSYQLEGQSAQQMTGAVLLLR